MGYYNTFVVKIWCDDHDEMIRGHIQHVSSQEYAHFSSQENMRDFILGHIGLPPSDSVTQNKVRGRPSFLTETMGDTIQNE